MLVVLAGRGTGKSLLVDEVVRFRDNAASVSSTLLANMGESQSSLTVGEMEISREELKSLPDDLDRLYVLPLTMERNTAYSDKETDHEAWLLFNSRALFTHFVDPRETQEEGARWRFSDFVADQEIIQTLKSVKPEQAIEMIRQDIHDLKPNATILVFLDAIREIGDAKKERDLCILLKSLISCLFHFLSFSFLSSIHSFLPHLRFIQTHLRKQQIPQKQGRRTRQHSLE